MPALLLFLVCKHTLAAFYETKQAHRSNQFTLRSPRDFYGHYQAPCDRCDRQLTPYGACTHLLSGAALWHCLDRS